MTSNSPCLALVPYCNRMLGQLAQLFAEGFFSTTASTLPFTIRDQLFTHQNQTCNSAILRLYPPLGVGDLLRPHCLRGNGPLLRFFALHLRIPTTTSSALQYVTVTSESSKGVRCREECEVHRGGGCDGERKVCGGL